MLRLIDDLLDRITSYRLTLYYLIALVIIAFGLSWGGYLQYNGIALAFTAGYLTIVCWLTNQIFSYVYDAPLNIESVYITALILTLIITPFKTTHDILFITAVACLAIASKFILAINKKHIFNPAAVAVALTAIGPGQTASWWVGSLQMLPFVFIGGLVLMRKIRHERMIIIFLISAGVSTLVTSYLSHHGITNSLQKAVLNSSLFFLAFVMLTEPITSPINKSKQTWYAIIAGLIFPPQVHILSYYSTPEVSLLIANIYAYLVGSKIRIIARLSDKKMVGKDIVNFHFKTDKAFDFKPGQYMEWTLPHANADSRGNRRYFTIASSPTEAELILGVKFYQNSSSFKQVLLEINNGSRIAGAQLGGDFILPKDKTQKLAFIAGGIGVTPFRSMIKFLIDTNEQRNVSLIYSDNSAQNFVYTDIFAKARHQIGARIFYTVTDKAKVPTDWRGETGYVNSAMIKSKIPDYSQRLFYISGSLDMVKSIKSVLNGMGISSKQIKTDYFPGLR